MVEFDFIALSDGTSFGNSAVVPGARDLRDLRNDSATQIKLVIEPIIFFSFFSSTTSQIRVIGQANFHETQRPTMRKKAVVSF